MNEIIVLLLIALGAISISAITYYYVKTHIRPYFGRITSFVYAWMFSATLTAYGYFIFSFILASASGDVQGAGFVFVGIIGTFVLGLILQAYSIYITNSKYRKLGYPVFYSVSVFGFLPVLWVLVTIHLALIFDFIYEREKAKID